VGVGVDEPRDDDLLAQLHTLSTFSGTSCSALARSPLLKERHLPSLHAEVRILEDLNLLRCSRVRHGAVEDGYLRSQLASSRLAIAHRSEEIELVIIESLGC
jgi:hypothetical protein